MRSHTRLSFLPEVGERACSSSIGLYWKTISEDDLFMTHFEDWLDVPPMFDLGLSRNAPTELAILHLFEFGGRCEHAKGDEI